MLDNRLKMQLGNLSSGVYGIEILFRRLSGKSLELRLGDRLMSSSRPIPSGLTMVSGDKMEADIVTNGTAEIYFIEIHQNIFGPDDPEAACVNYPTKEFKSYSACDDAFIVSSLPSLGIGDQMPVWATKDLATASGSFAFETQERVLKYWSTAAYLFAGLASYASNESSSISHLSTGVSVSTCPKPCTTTKVVVRRSMRAPVGDMKWEKNITNSFFLQFSPEVRQTETEIVHFAFLSYMSLTFANLGFLLGINLPKILSFVADLHNKYS
jgi:hypothetical protein